MARIPEGRMRPWQTAGSPSSGLTGTYAGDDLLEAGALLWDTTNGVLYVNEGTGLSPYWTPVGFEQDGIFGVHTDFRDRAGKALADTAAEAIIPGSGLRVFGQGVEVNGDSGLVVNAAGEGGSSARLHATNEASHVIAIGMEAGVMQPDQHGVMVVDVELSMVTDILARALYVGFVGLAADALDPTVTGATTVATLIQDDMAGIHMDSNYTDADGIHAVHNKSNANATQTAIVASPAAALAAAGTFQRFRVEIAADGDMLCFVDKVQTHAVAIALDVDEECSPVVYMETEAAATITMDVRRFAAWATR